MRQGRVTVSVVIVCMDRLDNLYPCIEGIRAHCSVPFEVLVVAYRFSPQSWEKVCEDYPWVTFVRSDSVRGFAENNNLALREARGEYCFVLNDDTLIENDVIGRLVRDFDLLPSDVAILTPRLLNADHTLQLCGRPEYPPFCYALQQWHLWSEPKDDTVGKEPVVREIFQTSNICGAGFLIKTDIFRSLGWFDEQYFFTPEDIALSQLTRSRGYGVYVDRGATLVHLARTTASRISTAVRPSAVRGSLIFFSRGSALRYGVLGVLVWLAEVAKYLKASIKQIFMPSPLAALSKEVYLHNSRSIFTRETPKQIFIKYFDQCQKF